MLSCILPTAFMAAVLYRISVCRTLTTCDTRSSRPTEVKMNPGQQHDMAYDTCFDQTAILALPALPALTPDSSQHFLQTASACVSPQLYV